jgi:MGT family glycosyltransferase
MGTAYNRLPGIFESILEGLGNEPITLIVTTGRDRDPASFGPQRSNVHIERYVPQSLLFPFCDVAVTHGGSGTVLTALGNGLPMVIVPVSADQPDNARRCEQIGVAQVIWPTHRSPATFRDAVAEVLHNPRYKHIAEGLRAEMEQLPAPETVVSWLEELLIQHRV